MAEQTAASAFGVALCYATTDKQWLLPLQVKPGTTLHQAIELSGILLAAPEIDLSVWRVGIFGKLAQLDTVLRPHDRIEIYRPLMADPMTSRRRRAAKRTGAK